MYDSVYLIFGRREVFLIVTILNNMFHAFSMLAQSSSGSSCLCILIHLFHQKWQTSYAIFDGEKSECFNMFFVVFEEWSYASLTTPNVLLAKDNWDLCLMNTSKLQRKLIIKFTKPLLRFQLTQLLNLFTLIYSHVIKMYTREV